MQFIDKFFGFFIDVCTSCVRELANKRERAYASSFPMNIQCVGRSKRKIFINNFFSVYKNLNYKS